MKAGCGTQDGSPRVVPVFPMHFYPSHPPVQLNVGRPQNMLGPYFECGKLGHLKNSRP